MPVKYLFLVINESKEMNRRNQYFRVFIAFCSLFILIFFNTCQKIDLTREALVQTNSYTMGNGVVTLTGTIVDLGEGITDHGFVVSNTPAVSSGSGSALRLGTASQTGQFTYNLSEASSGGNYSFCAFATSGGETIYGESSNFSTPDLVVTTQTATIQNKSSAILNGVINDLGFESVTEYGFYWSHTENPQGVNKVEVGYEGSTGAFSTIISGLTFYTDYYYVAYATNNTGTKYGGVTRFKIENVWTQIRNFEGSARYCALAFSLENIGYITGGHDTGPISDFYQFTTDSETWTSISSGISPVNGTAFTIGNKAYIINSNNLYEFDPENGGAWVAKTPFPEIERWNMFAFSVGNRGYVGSGAYKDGEQNVYLNEFWEFNPRDPINGLDGTGNNPMGSWTQKADFQGPGRMWGEGFSVAGLGYVCSGSNDNNLIDFWQYDPDSNDWSQKTDYPGPPGTGMVSFIIGNKAYLFNYELWQYDPGTENWTKMADFPGQQRWAPAGFAINKKGYIGTGTYNDGSNDIYMDDFWEYLPVQE